MVKTVLLIKIFISISLKVSFKLIIEPYGFFTVGARYPTCFLKKTREIIGSRWKYQRRSKTIRFY